MRENPWMVIDLLTDETLGRYATEVAALSAHMFEPVTVIYRPGNKKVKK